MKLGRKLLSVTNALAYYKIEFNMETRSPCLEWKIVSIKTLSYQTLVLITFTVHAEDCNWEKGFKMAS
jgi:hypothetical protein